jgi:hypothetical protein
MTARQQGGISGPNPALITELLALNIDMAALTTVVALTRVRGARRHVDRRVDHCGRTI